MIQCYTPMNNNDESVKDAFYMKTQSTAGNKKNGKIKMLMDDLKVTYDYRQAENAHTQF